MSPQETIERANRWPRRIYFLGLGLCLLGVVGLGVLLLAPEATLEAWLTESVSPREAFEGRAGSSARLSPDTSILGVPHNESAEWGEESAQREPTPFVDAARKTPPSARQAPAPPATLAAAEPVAAGAVVPEQGMGEITIVALMPGAHVAVADQVITSAPTTLRVPWPANYEVAVRLGEETVYETRVRLTAENNKLSLAVDPEVGV